MSTVTEPQNVAVVRGVYEALGRGDLDELGRLLSPGITLLVPGRSTLAGLYDGRDAVFGFLGAMQAAAGGTYRAELRDLFASDTQVVAVHKGTGTRGDKTLAADAALVFEVSGDMVAAITVHQQRQDGWDEFFS